MNTESEFVEAIQVNRHDEALRLRYAQWLEQSGLEQADLQAEFLRLECQLVRTWWYDQQQSELQVRLEKLRRELNKDWIAAVRRCTTPAVPIDVNEAIPDLRGRGKTAVRLHPRPGTAPPSASKIGGLFLWPKDETWPECEEHECPLVPALQLRKSDIPELGFPDGTDLFQVLWCPNDHEPSYCVAPRVYWRDSASVQQPKTSQPGAKGPKGFDFESEQYIPKPCLLYPERVLEYPDSFENQASIESTPLLEQALTEMTGPEIGNWSYPEDVQHLYQVGLGIS